jgi:glycosyltransferase involved in cell wall biosynthesis
MERILHVRFAKRNFDARTFKSALVEKEFLQVEGIYIIGTEDEHVNEKTSVIGVKASLKTYQKIPFLKTFILYYKWYRRVYEIIKSKKITILSLHNVNDLLVLLPIIFSKKNFKIIYCPHELETETTWLLKNKRHKYIFKIIERFFIKYVDEVIVVSSLIASWYEKEYSLKKTPTVVRNIPLNKDGKQIQREIDLKKQLSIRYEEILFLYHGMLNKGSRGIEETLDIFCSINSPHVLFIGEGDYLKEILNARKNHQNIHHIPFIPNDQLFSYIIQSDVGINIGAGKSLNALYSLPNKLFECMQAGIPVLYMNIPEISIIIKKCNIGWVAESLTEVRQIIESITIDTVIEKKQVVEKMKSEFLWETEAEKIRVVYRSLLDKTV